jgi:hypothetical protein
MTLNFSLMTSGPYLSAGLTSGLLEAHASQKWCSKVSTELGSPEGAATCRLPVK